MTNEERDIITQFIARVGGEQAPASRRSAARCRRPRGAAAAGRSRGGPADRRPVQPLSRSALPHHPARLCAGACADRGAEPSPAAGMGAAAGAAGGPAGTAAAAQRCRGGGFFSGLFGGGSRSGAPPQQRPAPAWNQGPQPGYQQGYQQAPPPPPPQYAPSYQPGMFQRSGRASLARR